MSKHKIAAGSAFDQAGYTPKIDWRSVSADRKRADAASTAVAEGKVSIGVEAVTAAKTYRRSQAELAMQPKKGRTP